MGGRWALVGAFAVGAVLAAIACGTSDASNGSPNGDGANDAASGGDGTSADGAPSDGGATGDASFDARPPPNVGTWHIVPSSTPEHLYAIWGSGPEDVYAVGGNFYNQNGYGGVLDHYKPRGDGGLAWAPEQVPPFAQLSYVGVAGTAPDRVLTIGKWYNPGPPPSGGTFSFAWDGGAWTQVPPPGNVALFGSPSSDFWATSILGPDAKVVHYEGGTWVTKLSSSAADTYGAVWASGAHAFVLGSGATPFIQHYDGSTWTKTPSPNNAALSAIWGSSPTDVFACGAGGTIVHFDGTTWTPMNSGTTLNLGAIWGSGPYDVFITTGEDTVLHYQNDVWVQEDIPDAGYSYYLYDIWGSGPSDIWGVGYKGLIMHRTP